MTKGRAEDGGRPAAEDPLPRLERNLDLILSLLVRHPGLRQAALDELGLEPSAFPDPWGAVLDAFLEDPGISAAALVSREAIRDNPRLVETVYGWSRAEDQDAAEAERALRDAARNLRVQALEREIGDLTQVMRDDPRRAADGELAQQLMALRAEQNRLREETGS